MFKSNSKLSPKPPGWVASSTPPGPLICCSAAHSPDPRTPCQSQPLGFELLRLGLVNWAPLTYCYCWTRAPQSLNCYVTAGQWHSKAIYIPCLVTLQASWQL